MVSPIHPLDDAATEIFKIKNLLIANMMDKTGGPYLQLV